MIVNYAKEAKVCLDEDGYRANIYGLEDCPGLKILDDPDDLNPNIYPCLNRGCECDNIDGTSWKNGDFRRQKQRLRRSNR